MQTSRETFVLDTCSLVNCSRELAGQKILALLYQMFHIVLPEKVNEELSTIRVKDPDLLTFARGFIDVRKELVRETSEYACCLNVVKEWFDQNKMSKEFSDLHPGEIHCLALALYIAKRERKFVILLTDDFKARRKGLLRFVLAQQIGIVRSTAEAVALLYALEQGIGESHAMAAIQDYVRNNTFTYYAQSYFLNLIDMSCRRLGSSLCLAKCL